MKKIGELTILPNSRTLFFLFLSVSVLALSTVARAQDGGEQKQIQQEGKEDSRSAIVGILLYLPNRVFDLLDIVRFKVRVGPGIAAGARVTELVELYAGTYTSLYAGFPGPRLKPTLPLPVGLESHNGVSASVVDATVDGGIGPDYSPTEVGAGFQLLILGFDFGIDVVEAADFVSGIFTIDLRSDDL